MENDEKLNQKIFDFLKENLTLDTESNYGGDVYLQLKLKNPATEQYEIIGYNYITIVKGEGYY